MPLLPLGSQALSSQAPAPKEGDSRALTHAGEALLRPAEGCTGAIELPGALGSRARLLVFLEPVGPRGTVTCDRGYLGLKAPLQELREQVFLFYLCPEHIWAGLPTRCVQQEAGPSAKLGLTRSPRRHGDARDQSPFGASSVPGDIHSPQSSGIP